MQKKKTEKKARSPEKDVRKEERSEKKKKRGCGGALSPGFEKKFNPSVCTPEEEGSQMYKRFCRGSKTKRERREIRR